MKHYFGSIILKRLCTIKGERQKVLKSEDCYLQDENSSCALLGKTMAMQ